MKINLLPSEVYNRISAGEVVENPASVVKELVENALDAGATAIGIRIEDGGIKSIEVSDNGSGIERAEIHKTVLPHATSKIEIASDLDTVSTLGTPHIGARSFSPQSLPVRVRSSILLASIASSKNIS